MTAWRLELTVLTDLSASIFAVCFMVLLIFIAHAGSTASPTPAAEPVPIDAEKRFHLVERRPGGSAGMVAMLYRHGSSGETGAGGTERAGVGIDLFEDRIEIRAPDSGTAIVVPADATGGRLASVVGAAPSPARLYVFSNALYAPTLAALAGSSPDVEEMSVPRFLRDPENETRGWSEAFLALGAERLSESAFRRRLAVLLDGSADKARRNAGAARAEEGTPDGGTSAAQARPPSVGAFWAEQFEAFARRLALLIPLVGALAAVWIRLDSGGVRAALAEPAPPAPLP